ncbi:MAG TPA: hypothetical protein VK849_05955 [Longimicrobiales bacterium]|nr:hypothetical protein [Longimicrobiales bacterium]
MVHIGGPRGRAGRRALSWAWPLLAVLACGEGATEPEPDDRKPVVTNPCEEFPRWLAAEPRVIDPSSTGDVTLSAVFAACVPDLSLVRAGSRTPFDSVAGTTAFLDVATQTFLAGHDPSDPHTFLGFIESRSYRLNGHFNVRTGDMPDVAVAEVAPDAQRSPHVLNLRTSEPYGGDPAPVLERLYELMGDDYEFVAVVSDASAFLNRSFWPLRNAVEGLGLDAFDRPAWWDGPTFPVGARLEGALSFPIGSLFDLGSPALLHELGHRWINFLGGPAALQSGQPHWPISDLADGIMSYSLPGGVGASPVWRLVPVEGGGTDLRLECSGSREFVYRDLELYLMGLVPPEEVEPHVVFTDQEQPTSCNSLWSGPTATVTVEDVIEANGARVPAFGAAPTSFRIATVVVSAGRLLAPHEMAFYDHMAARGSATTPLRYSSGFEAGTVNPFWLATGGRATLETRLR